jgi:hypothetical protein
MAQGKPIKKAALIPGIHLGLYIFTLRLEPWDMF